MTDPFPDPVAPAVTVSQEALLAAVQAQPAETFIVAVPVPPAAVKEPLVGDSV